MKKTKKAIASLAIAGMALTMIPFNALAAEVTPTRLGGYTAAETAVQIADETGWSGTAILSSSASYGMVDALTSGPLAAFLKAPILLQEAGNVLNPNTQAELIKLNVKTVYVTSGTAVISQAVLNQLTSMGITVVPLGGSDRFETSVNIAKKMVELGASVSKVAIAFGWLSQDALSIASIASAQTQPILLTEKDTVPASVRAFLSTNTSVTSTNVIGGTGVISDAVSAQFPNATRQFGYTAYDTNLAVLKAFESVLKYDRVFIANGETAIDALAGAPLAAKYNSGIVLTNGTANEGTNYVKTKLSATSVVTALGGTAVVPEVVRTGIVYVPPVVPPVVPPSGGGGGGGGGGGTPVVTTASVSNAADLNFALTNLNITKITFTGNIDNTIVALPLIANHSLDLDFGVFVLTGNVTFQHALTGTSNLLATGAAPATKSITGDLTVDTTNASFVNKAAVNGNVNIVNIKIGTWTESVDGNKLVITDSNGSTIIIEGSPGSITVSETATGLVITVNAGETVGNIICNGPVKIINNGTISTLTANAAVELEANVAPTNMIIGAGGNLVITGDQAESVSKSVLQATITYAGTLVQANYTAASWTAMQTALAAAGLVNANVAATATQVTSATTALRNGINGLVLLPKITATSISGYTLTADTLTFSFANLTKNSGITVSKDAKLSLSIGSSGPIGDLTLRAGASNNLLNAPLPTNDDLVLTPTNMSAIFNAIKSLEPAEKQAVLNTVDFAKVFELVLETDQETQDLVFAAIGFEDFYKAIHSADAATKVRILDNMTSVLDVALDDSQASAFKLSVVVALFPLLDTVTPALSPTQKSALTSFIGNTDLKSLFNSLDLSVAQKESLLDQMNYTALFESVMDDLSPATRAKMFKEVNFTDLLTAIKSADAAEKTKIAENLVDVMEIIEESDISRVDMLNALVFGANKRDALFQILKNLDGSGNSYVTVTATLTDAASNTTTYTIKINEN